MKGHGTERERERDVFHNLFVLSKCKIYFELFPLLFFKFQASCTAIILPSVTVFYI